MRKPTDGRAARGRRATPDRVCGRRDLAGLPQWQPVVERCGRAPLPGSNHLRRRSRWNTGTPEKPTPIPAGNNQTRQGVPGDLVAASVDHTSKVLTESGGPFLVPTRTRYDITSHLRKKPKPVAHLPASTVAFSSSRDSTSPGAAANRAHRLSSSSRWLCGTGRGAASAAILSHRSSTSRIFSAVLSLLISGIASTRIAFPFRRQ